tara:strand:+ start:880 stop:2193 length:1314 start_codon:yes stop_codon:yes gene_type:complete
MQWDLVLIAKLVRGDENRRGTFRKLKGLGVTEKIFSTLLRPVWNYMRDCEAETGKIPSEAMLLEKFPGVTFPDYPAFSRVVEEDSVDEVVRLLRERHMSAIAQELGSKLVATATTDPKKVPELLQQGQEEILSTIPVPMVTTVGSDLEGDMVEYAKFGDPGGAGLQFPYMQIVSGGLGLNGSGIYCLYGSPGMKKTWMFMYWAIWYWLKGYRVLFLTQEMPWERLKWRAYAMRGGLDWTDLTEGNTDKGMLRQVISEFRSTKRFYVRDPITTQDARPIVQGIIAQFEPDIIFHDSSYLCNLTIGKDSGAIRGSAFLAQEWISFMKNTANANRIPYFFTWQPNKDGDLYMTSAAEQDCELILRIDGAKAGNHSTLEIKKNRDGRPLSGSDKLRVATGLCDGFGKPILDLGEVIRTKAGPSRKKSEEHSATEERASEAC